MSRLWKLLNCGKAGDRKCIPPIRENINSLKIYSTVTDNLYWSVSSDMVEILCIFPLSFSFLAHSCRATSLMHGFESSYIQSQSCAEGVSIISRGSDAFSSLGVTM